MNLSRSWRSAGDGGARHWSLAMTLIQTAKLNGVEPVEWLTDVLERTVSGRIKAVSAQTLTVQHEATQPCEQRAD